MLTARGLSRPSRPSTPGPEIGSGSALVRAWPPVVSVPLRRRTPPSPLATSSSDAATLATSTPTATTATTPPSPSPSFSWTRQWYPVLCTKTCPGPGPHAVTLLGRDLVVWRKGDASTYGCLDDACSHRAAPLSEGRVELDGHLHCAYHGWAFDGCGSCQRCPQAETPAALATIRASPRSSVRAYPTRVEGGLVFVWPDAEAGSAARAASAPPPVLPTEVLAAAETKGWYVRDLPYSVDALLENVLDPSHLPVSHDGLAGLLKRANAKPVPMVAIVEDEEGKTAASKNPAGTAPLPPPPPHAPGTPRPTLDFRIASVLAPVTDTRPLSRLSWWAPALVRYRYAAGATIFSTNLFCVPTSPGRSRVFLLDGAYPATPDPNSPPPLKPNARSLLLMRVARLLFSLRPDFMGHAAQGDIFDGDGVFINAQMARLVSAGGAWRKLYYMPATCDAAVAGLRAWLDGPGGGGPAWATGAWSGGLVASADVAAAVAAAPVPRSAMLDRAAQHVRLCAVCQVARGRLELARKVATAVGGSVLLAAAFAAGRGGLTPRLGLVAGCAAAVAALAHRAATRWLTKFGFVDYVHSTKGPPQDLPPEPVLLGKGAAAAAAA